MKIIISINLKEAGRKMEKLSSPTQPFWFCSQSLRKEGKCHRERENEKENE